MKTYRWLIALLLIALVAVSCGRDDDGDSAGGPGTTADSSTNEECEGETLEATEIGVTSSEIHIQVMADIGSPLAPGLFQGNVDALNAFAEYINDNGGLACRDLVVETWDSKLSAEESKNGLINACKNALAMVGDNALFNPDVSPMVNCVDKAGATTGVPNIAALAVDINEQCAKGVYLIQAVFETCPIKTPGPREFHQMVGPQQWYLEEFGDLHGVFLVPGDLPTTVQSATALIKAQLDAGVKFDATLKISGRDEQAAFTPRVQQIKASNANYVYNGSNDRAMINIRKEAKAQGANSVELWACSLSCYTRNFLATGGADVEDTYFWMQFLPFEEADVNEEAARYVNAVGESKIDSFGAQAWQAAVLFKQVIDQIVEEDGLNGITRAKMLEVLDATENFDANGWAGEKDLRGFSPCFVVMKVEGGKFVRAYPEKAGTFDCDEDNIVSFEIDPVAEAAKIK